MTSIRNIYLALNTGARKEIIRFLLSGVVVSAVDFGLYFVLFHSMAFSLAKGISFSCSCFVGYFLNKHWTFQCSQTSASEVGRYTLVNVLALGIDVFINQALLDLWPGKVVPALAAASVATSVFVFISFKWWVYKTELS